MITSTELAALTSKEEKTTQWSTATETVAVKLAQETPMRKTRVPVK